MCLCDIAIILGSPLLRPSGPCAIIRDASHVKVSYQRTPKWLYYLESDSGARGTGPVPSQDYVVRYAADAVKCLLPRCLRTLYTPCTAYPASSLCRGSASPVWPCPSRILTQDPCPPDLRNGTSCTMSNSSRVYGSVLCVRVYVCLGYVCLGSASPV